MLSNTTEDGVLCCKNLCYLKYSRAVEFLLLILKYMSFSLALFQGKFVTSRNLRDRLYRELERNLAMKVEDGETADTFLVSGRGTLHLTILIENM